MIVTTATTTANENNTPVTVACRPIPEPLFFVLKSAGIPTPRSGNTASQAFRKRLCRAVTINHATILERQGISTNHQRCNQYIRCFPVI
jgi:hypothetical protein